MWTISSLVEDANLTQDQADDLISQLIDVPDLLTLALSPISIIVFKEVSAEPINLILNRFISTWKRTEGDELEYSPTPEFHVPYNYIDQVAPLLAVCCVNPHANLDLVNQVATICSETTKESNLPISFWGYIGAYISDDRSDYFGTTCEIWRDGFFDNGLPQDLPSISQEQITALALMFVENCETWFHDYDYNDIETKNNVGALLALRPELSDEILAKFALMPFPEVARAVIANPSSSDSTKETAQLNC